MSPEINPNRQRSQRRRRWAVVLALCIGLSAVSGPIWADDSTADLEARRAEVRSQAAATASEIDLLIAEDAEVAAALVELDEWIAVVQADIDAAEQAIEVAGEEARRATAEAAQLDEDLSALEDLLGERAVEAYVRPGGATTQAVLEADDLNAVARRRFLIGITQDDINSVLDGIRVARAEREDHLEIAESARQAADSERTALNARLDELAEAKSAQEEIKAELELRIADYRRETSALEAADDQLTELIRRAQEPPPVVEPAVEQAEEQPDPAETVEPEPTPEPTATPEATPEVTPEPTGGGNGSLQWPISGPIVSEFGMRVHPIFGDTRMHTGLDIDGDTGQPIGAAASGTVIFAGWQEGYGNVVILDHGSGLSTVYAHMSALGASEGSSVDSGQSVGQVGSTGYSTGPHLHFETRLDGNAVDPRQYLP